MPKIEWEFSQEPREHFVSRDFDNIIKKLASSIPAMQR